MKKVFSFLKSVSIIIQIILEIAFLIISFFALPWALAIITQGGLKLIIFAFLVFPFIFCLILVSIGLCISLLIQSFIFKKWYFIVFQILILIANILLFLYTFGLF